MQLQSQSNIVALCGLFLLVLLFGCTSPMPGPMSKFPGSNENLQNVYTMWETQIKNQDEQGYNVKEAQELLKELKTKIENNQLSEGSEFDKKIGNSMSNLKMKTCAERKGHICKPSRQEWCEGKSIQSSDSDGCCNQKCTTPPEAKTCAEVGGYICKMPETTCDGKGFIDSEGKDCCYNKCTPMCEKMSCSEYEKCEKGICKQKTCQEIGGSVCSNNTECTDISLIIEGKECCTTECKTHCERYPDDCKDADCGLYNKNVNGVCKPKSCSEIKGNICNEPKEVCMGTAILGSDGYCCLTACEDRTSCKNMDCEPFSKCVEGVCKLKTCSEYSGAICTTNTNCTGNGFIDANGKDCCTAECKTQCERYPCQANEKCDNGICVIKTCAEQNGYACSPPSTQCYGSSSFTGDTQYCCSEPCKSPCEVQPCAPNQSCVGGQCVYKTCAEQGGNLCDVFQHTGCDGNETVSSESYNSGQYVCCVGTCITEQQ